LIKNGPKSGPDGGDILKEKLRPVPEVTSAIFSTKLCGLLDLQIDLLPDDCVGV
jgi:hypothetical protein